jgi:hypothetical protein
LQLCTHRNSCLGRGPGGQSGDRERHSQIWRWGRGVLALIMPSANSVSRPKDSHSPKHSNLQHGKQKCYFRATKVPFCPVYHDTGKTGALFEGS